MKNESPTVIMIIRYLVAAGIIGLIAIAAMGIK